MARSLNPEDGGVCQILFLGRIRLLDRRGSVAPPSLPQLMPMSHLPWEGCPMEWHPPCQDAISTPLLPSGIGYVAEQIAFAVARLIINQASPREGVGMTGFTHFHTRPLVY